MQLRKLFILPFIIFSLSACIESTDDDSASGDQAFTASNLVGEYSMYDAENEATFTFTINEDGTGVEFNEFETSFTWSVTDEGNIEFYYASSAQTHVLELTSGNTLSGTFNVGVDLNNDDEIDEYFILSFTRTGRASDNPGPEVAFDYQTFNGGVYIVEWAEGSQVFDFFSGYNSGEYLDGIFSGFDFQWSVNASGELTTSGLVGGGQVATITMTLLTGNNDNGTIEIKIDFDADGTFELVRDASFKAVESSGISELDPSDLVGKRFQINDSMQNMYLDVTFSSNPSPLGEGGLLASDINGELYHWVTVGNNLVLGKLDNETQTIIESITILTFNGSDIYNDLYFITIDADNDGEIEQTMQDVSWTQINI